MSSAREQFQLAVQTLTGPEPQRTRVVRACKSHLLCLCLADVPSEIRLEFARVLRLLTAWPAGEDLCDVEKAVSALDDKEVTALIGAILWMHEVVARGQSDDRSDVDAHKENVVISFPSKGKSESRYAQGSLRQLG